MRKTTERLAAPIIALCVLGSIAIIALSSTVASVTQTERDEAVKVAAAEAGCDYANQVLNCGAGR